MDSIRSGVVVLLPADLFQEFRGNPVGSQSSGENLVATFDGPARSIRCAQAILDTALLHPGSLIVRVCRNETPLLIRYDTCKITNA